MNSDDATEEKRRALLQAAGAAAGLALSGMPFAAGTATGEGTKFAKVGIMSPGDMGQAVAMQIKSNGLDVYTALGQRSERTRALARDAGLIDVGTIARLVAECDVILSIINPGAALELAREIADAMRRGAGRPLFVECNAIAPQTAREVGAAIMNAGGRFLDASIIGAPPRGKAKANLYVSGAGAADVQQLATAQLVVHPIGEGVVDASALKMCYSALNKGTQLLWLEALIAARRLGVDGLLEQQLRQSRTDFYGWALDQFPSLPPKAARWVPEMLQVSQTLASAGIGPRVFEGAADTCDFVAATALAKETPENRDRSRSGKEVVRFLAAARKRS